MAYDDGEREWLDLRKHDVKVALFVPTSFCPFVFYFSKTLLSHISTLLQVEEKLVWCKWKSRVKGSEKTKEFVWWPAVVLTPLSLHSP